MAERLRRNQSGSRFTLLPTGQPFFQQQTQGTPLYSSGSTTKDLPYDLTGKTLHHECGRVQASVHEEENKHKGIYPMLPEKKAEHENRQEDRRKSVMDELDHILSAWDKRIGIKPRPLLSAHPGQKLLFGFIILNSFLPRSVSPFRP